MTDTLRTLSILVLVCLLLAGSVGYVRVADVNFGSQKTIDENPTPQERIAFGLEDLTRTNYRMEQTATLRNRTSGSVWYRQHKVKRVNHNSEEIYISNYYGEPGDKTSFYQYKSKRQPWKAVAHDAEWQLTPPDDVDWKRNAEGNRHKRYSPTEYRIPLNASAEWRVINQTDNTVVVGIESVDKYRYAFNFSREAYTADNGSVYVHFDKETGTIQKIVVNEVGIVEFDPKDKPIPTKMKIVYDFDRSGDVSIAPPEPARGFSFKGLLGDLIMY